MPLSETDQWPAKHCALLKVLRSRLANIRMLIEILPVGSKKLKAKKERGFVRPRRGRVGSHRRPKAEVDVIFAGYELNMEQLLARLAAWGLSQGQKAKRFGPGRITWKAIFRKMLVLQCWLQPPHLKATSR